MNAGLLILRLVVGIALAGHGAQKLFGWWGGPGLGGLRDHLTHMRFRPAPLWVAGAIATEIGGGLLLSLGLLSPLGSVGVGAAMLMAIVAFHWGKGFFGQGGGFEVPLLYLVPASVLGITGPGTYSLDSLLGITLPEPVTGLVAAALAVAGVAFAMIGRRPAAVAEQRPAELAA
jgi:putative oxidoreductase